MILNFKRGAQVLGKKIADLDAGGAQPASAASQAETPAASSAAFQPATPVLIDSSQANESRHEIEDWRDLLIRLLAFAPEDVSTQLINCLSRDVLVKALEKRSDPYLKVALLLLKK